MTTINDLFLILGMGIVTYLTRRAFLRLPDHLLSERLKNGLSFIPLGIFAALIFPTIFIDEKSLVFQPLVIIASVLCVLVMKITKNVFVSFCISLLLVIFVKTGILPFPV